MRRVTTVTDQKDLTQPTLVTKDRPDPDICGWFADSEREGISAKPTPQMRGKSAETNVRSMADDSADT